jgi:hypothetical protein
VVNIPHNSTWQISQGDKFFRLFLIITQEIIIDVYYRFGSLGKIIGANAYFKFLFLKFAYTAYTNV